MATIELTVEVIRITPGPDNTTAITIAGLGDLSKELTVFVSNADAVLMIVGEQYTYGITTL